jgi:hypothetical protein
MTLIGKYYEREIYCLDYNKFENELPDDNWICLSISNIEPNVEKFEKFVRKSIEKGILEFKGHGKFGEKLHDLFDETMVEMEVVEEHSEIGVMTTWHNNETLADTFWQCFFATCLPETSDLDNIKIVCIDLDGINRTEELKSYLKEFELGWLPEDNIKHEVWEDSEGLTTLCLSDERGDDCRKLLDPKSILKHSFYAESHFEAMQIYYKFMNWEEYMTEFEIDKEPYGKIKNAL